MARKLRAEGLLLREIGERMGVSPKTVHCWLTDPGGARLRARKDGYRGVCGDCGALTTDVRHRLCRECRDAREGMRRRLARERRALEMLELRRAGMLTKDIAARFGMHPTQVPREFALLREMGVDVPRSPWFLEERAAA